MGDGAGVPPNRSRPDGCHHGPGSRAGEGSGVGREFLIDRGPVFHGQAGRLFHEIHGALFVELAGVQRAKGVRHFDDQGFRHPEQAAAAVRGFAAGQRDLLSRTQVPVFAAVLAQVLR
ncbi:hypothetical protein [Arthrobacter globiformis]|uniref:hypothetical protein n=1 Tax=Arthrobacter globiformis TaxID=1665 RepID=UPI003F7A9079